MNDILERIRDDRNYYCHENFLDGINDNYEITHNTSIKEECLHRNWNLWS